MLISSEYVSLGHPDRTCDTIAANLINRIQHKDKENSHAAIEVFASDDTIVFGGEAKTTLKLNKKLLKDVVRESFKACGYRSDKRERFKKEEVYLADDCKHRYGDCYGTRHYQLHGAVKQKNEGFAASRGKPLFK